MQTKTDQLFGRIAVNAGLVTEEQVEECVRVQQALRERKPLGLILIEKGYITEAQVQKLIEVQRQNLSAQAIRSRERRADSLFGKLVIRFGFASEDQVNEALVVQAEMEMNRNVRLGELLIQKGFMSAEQVNRILEYQKGKLVNCPKCGMQHNVVLFQTGEIVTCHKCAAEVVVP